MDRSDLIAYVWVYWCLADGASGRSSVDTKVKKSQRGRDGGDALTRAIEFAILEGDTRRRVEKVKHLILKQREATSPETSSAVERLLTEVSFPMRLPDADTSSPCGYVRDNCALWIRPNSEYLQDVLNTTAANPATLFYEDKTFAVKLARFPSTDRFRSWRDGELNPLRVLSRDEKLILERLTPSFDVRFRGAVVAGNDSTLDRGVVWIGVRPLLDVEGASYRECAWRLRRPVDFISLMDVPKALAPFARQDLPPLTESLATDFLDSLGISDPARAEIASDDEMRFFAHNGRLIAITTLERALAEKAAFQRTRQSTASHIDLVDREKLESGLAADVVLWATHIARDSGFVAVRDQRRVRHYLIGDHPDVFWRLRSRLLTMVAEAVASIRDAVTRLFECDSSQRQSVISEFERRYREALWCADPLSTCEYVWPVGECVECDASEMASYLVHSIPSSESSSDRYLQTHLSALGEDLWMHRAVPALAPLLPIDERIHVSQLRSFRGDELNIRVSGRPGSGKSSTVYSLLAERFAGALTVIVSPLTRGVLSDQIAKELPTMISAWCREPTVVVIDQLEQQLGMPPQETLLYRLLLANDELRRHSRQTFSVIVTHWPRDAAFAETYSPVFRRWSFVEWSLDSPDPDFLREVGQHVISAAALAAHSRTIVEKAIATNATARSLTERLLRPNESDGRSSDAHFWEHSFRELVASQQAAAVALLKTICILESLDTRATHPRLLAFVSGWLGYPRVDVLDALDVLERSGWISRNGEGRIVADEAQLNVLAEHSHDLERAIEDAVLAAVLELPDESRRAVLASGSRGEDSDRAMPFLKALIDLDPEKEEQYARQAATFGERAMDDDGLRELIVRCGETRRVAAYEYSSRGEVCALLRILPDIRWEPSEDFEVIYNALNRGSASSGRVQQALDYVRSGTLSLHDLELLQSAVSARGLDKNALWHPLRTLLNETVRNARDADGSAEGALDVARDEE